MIGIRNRRGDHPPMGGECRGWEMLQSRHAKCRDSTRSAGEGQTMGIIEELSCRGLGGGTSGRGRQRTIRSRRVSLAGRWLFPASRGCQTAPGRVAGTRLGLMPG